MRSGIEPNATSDLSRFMPLRQDKARGIGFSTNLHSSLGTNVCGNCGEIV